MSVAPADPSAVQNSGPQSVLHIRSIYRDAQGEIHFDWPSERIKEAIDDQQGTAWIDIEDPDTNSSGAAEALLCETFKFHPLAVDDAIQETHIPKVDDWGDYLYIVFHSIDFDPETDRLRLHELDVFLARHFVVTYHNKPLKFLDQERSNIRRDPVNRLRHGAPHLLYHFLDLAVAEFLPAIEHLDNTIDEVQEEVFQAPTPQTLQQIFRVKRSILKLHRTISPQREVLNRLARDSYDPIPDDVRVYFRDVYDHLVRIHDLSESLRDLVSGALDTYLSAISNRTNDIMKALTLVTVMFLPMSFLSGFFGMNFFGETLAFAAPLPKTFLFVVSCVLMAVGCAAPWILAWRRRWF